MTGKQRQFVEYYLGVARCNASEAARLAGYSCPGQQAHETLKNLEVQAAIKARTAEIAASADEVLRVLTDQMRGPGPECFTTAGAVDQDALRKAGKLHLVKTTKKTKYGLSVELYDAQAAAVQLAKHHGLLSDDGGGVTVTTKVYVGEDVRQIVRGARVADDAAG